MTAEDYRKTMIDVLKLQIKETEEDIHRYPEREVFYSGIEAGLSIAVDKLELSKFLTKE